MRVTWNKIVMLQMIINGLLLWAFYKIFGFEAMVLVGFMLTIAMCQRRSA